MEYIFSDNNSSSEMSKKCIEAKKTNDSTFWSTMREVIDYDFNTLNKDAFRRWASIACIPLANNSRMWKPIATTTSIAIDDEKIRDLLVEEWVGVDEEYRREFRIYDDYDTSAHRCYNVDHLLTYDQFNSIDEISSYKNIVEVGGGYGDMCGLIHKLGFSGNYYMLDFPEIHQLQKYYLGRIGFSHVNYITEIAELPTAPDLVIGTWSISEMPMDVRDEMIDQVIDSKHWLITYQNNIFGNSNHKYFVDKFANIDYAIENIDYMPYDGGNNYLIV